MRDLSYSGSEIEILQSLLLDRLELLVWDVNAFYFNNTNTTIKLECIADIPEGADSAYSEICFTRIYRLKEKLEFQDNEKGKAYKIVVRDFSISKIDILTAKIKFPEENFIETDPYSKNDFGVNIVSLGLLIEIDQGFIPAYILKNNFGFIWQQKYSIYKKDEIFIPERIQTTPLN